MTELSPFSFFLLQANFSLWTKYLKNSLSYSHDIWIIDCVLGVDDLINFW